MQTKMDDNNENDEKVMKNIKLWCLIKTEMDTELGKNSYPLETVNIVFEQIKLDDRTEYIQQHKQTQYSKTNIETSKTIKSDKPEDAEVWQKKALWKLAFGDNPDPIIKKEVEDMGYTKFTITQRFVNREWAEKIIPKKE